MDRGDWRATVHGVTKINEPQQVLRIPVSVPGISSNLNKIRCGSHLLELR